MTLSSPGDIKARMERRLRCANDVSRHRSSIATSVVAGLLLAGLLSLPTTAAAEIGGPTVSRGPGAELLLGANFCIKNNEAECDDITPGFGMSFGLLWRFIPYLSVDVDFYFGMLTYEQVVGVSSARSDITELGILVGPRAYLPIGPVDLFFGLGIGYGRINEQMVSDSPYISEQIVDYRTDGFELGFTFGVAWRIIDLLSLGAILRYHIPFFDELCSEEEGEEEVCINYEDLPDDDIIRQLIFGISLTVYFTRPRTWASGDRGEQQRPTSERVCDPGATQECLCVGGGRGVQSCADNGDRWERCECSTGQAPRVCAPGATQACTCIDGTSGVQICETNGQLWGSCQCVPSEPEDAGLDSSNPFSTDDEPTSPAAEEFGQ